MTHKLSLPWDISKSSAEIYAMSMMKVLGIEPPVSIIIECPTWRCNFKISKERTIKKNPPNHPPNVPQIVKRYDCL
jgi:hypothetical protein